VIYICTAADIYTRLCVPEGLVLLPLSSGPSTETGKAGRWLILCSRQVHNFTTRKRGGFIKGFFFCCCRKRSLYFLGCFISISNVIVPYKLTCDEVMMLCRVQCCVFRDALHIIIYSQTADLLYIGCALRLRIHLLCENDIYTCFQNRRSWAAVISAWRLCTRCNTEIKVIIVWSLLLRFYHTPHIFTVYELSAICKYTTFNIKIMCSKSLKVDFAGILCKKHSHPSSHSCTKSNTTHSLRVHLASEKLAKPLARPSLVEPAKHCV